MKKCYTVCKKQVFHDFRLEPSEEAQQAPKTTPGASPGTPKATPEASRAAPESPKSAPGEAQEPPGGTPKSVYTRFCPPESPKTARERPRSHLRERFWSLPGLIWELVGSPGDFIFKLFRSCPRTLRLQPLCPTNAGSAGPALAFTILRRLRRALVFF